MEQFVRQIRASYRTALNVTEVNDLPLVLLTEVINQSILHGATQITVTSDGKVFLVKDNAKPYGDDDLPWMLTCRHEGMMDAPLRRMFRILDRQWASPPFCAVNALCSEFKLIVSKGERTRCIVCRDGIVVSDKVGDLGLGDGNLVIMDPMIAAGDDDMKILADMMAQIESRFPQVRIECRTKPAFSVDDAQ